MQKIANAMLFPQYTIFRWKSSKKLFYNYNNLTIVWYGFYRLIVVIILNKKH